MIGSFLISVKGSHWCPPLHTHWSSVYLYDCYFKFSYQTYYLYLFHFGILLWFGSVASFGKYFSVSSFCLTFCICFCVLGKSATFLALNDNSFMKKGSYSALQCGVPCSPGPSTSRNISYVCCVCFAVESGTLFPSVQLYAEPLFAYRGQCLVPSMGECVLTRCVVVCWWNQNWGPTMGGGQEREWWCNLCWFSWGGVHSTRSEGSMPETGGSTNVQGAKA